MGNEIKKEYILVGLNCSNCAAKIEREINNINGVNSASVDFVTKKLIIKLNDNVNLKDIIKTLKSIVKDIESGVNVIEKEVYQSSQVLFRNVSNTKLTKLVIGFALIILPVSMDFSNKIEFSLFFISYLIIGGDILLKAFKNIIKGKIFDENFLMSTATLGAFLIGEYSEGVAVMLFYQIGELFQDMAINRSRKSIASLMDIRPDYATVIFDDIERKVSPNEVKLGDIIIIKPGEKVPLDGIIIGGQSTLNYTALTGESLPHDVKIDDQILSGSINQNGVITVRVTKSFEESTVSKILDLIENASSKKAVTENFITKFAAIYTPVVVVIAILIAIIPPIIIDNALFSDWIYRALIFLVISCPCALVISIPLGFFSGIGNASKNGILIKGSNYLEGLNEVDSVVFDKTGTLTKGVFQVTEIFNVLEVTNDEVLEYAAYAEHYSNHPIAISIKDKYHKELDISKIESYNEIPGFGVITKVDGKEIIAGNDKLLTRENIQFNKTDLHGTILYIAVDRLYIGYIRISDEIKADSKDAIHSLRKVGVKKIIMLTGDNTNVAKSIADDIGIDEYYAELLPNDKVKQFEMIKLSSIDKAKKIFVGDGINDAPVLAMADIGVAMGGLGSDAAIEAADIVIMTDQPSKIALAIQIAKRTRSIVWQNILFALGVKALVLILGAFGIATMWEAVFADVGVTLIAILNAMRIQYNK